MSYPERGATYRNKPAWMDRAVAGEKRAQGGPVSIGNREVGNGAGVSDVADAATEDAKDDLSNAMNRPGSDSFHDSGVRIPGKLKAKNDEWSNNVRSVRTRADGGRMEPLIDQRGRLSTDGDMDEPPTRMMLPSSPEAGQDARDQAAERMQRTRATPFRTFESKLWDKEVAKANDGEPERKSGGRVRRGGRT